MHIIGLFIVDLAAKLVKFSPLLEGGKKSLCLQFQLSFQNGTY